MTENASVAARSYRQGDWFGIFGNNGSVLLPPSEKARVAGLWGLVDAGAGFDELLDELIAGGLRGLPGFVLVSAGAEPTRVVLRGAARAGFVLADGSTVELDGAEAATWVERSLDGVESMLLEVSEEGTEVDFAIDGGLVRVARVDQPPYAEAAEEPGAEVAAVVVDDEAVDDEPVGDEPAEAADELVIDESAEELAADEPVAEEPVAVEPMAVEPVVEEPVAVEPVVEEPVVEEPVVEEPVAEQPVAEQPVAEQPVAEQPVAVEPVVEEPAAVEPVPAPLTEPVEVVGGAPQAAPAAPAWQQPGNVYAPPPAPSNPFAAPPPPGMAPYEPPAPPQPDPADYDHDGHTVAGGWDPNQFVRQHPGIPGQPQAPSVTAVPVARLVFSNGETVDVDRAVLIGRAPEARRFTSTEQPRLVTVPSPNQEISSTHLEVRPGSGADHGSAVVTDMGSTNGTVLQLPGLAPDDLQPGIAVQLIPGSVIDLGDGVTIQVTHP
jgi:hypothetical protein